MANSSPDDVAELKQELAQFLLTEITSAQGQQTFRKEVSAEVAAVIDQVLNQRLTPALQTIERQAAEQMNQLTARVDGTLRRFEQAAPVVGPSPETEKMLAELTARLDEMWSRLVRMEEQGRRAVAQPLAMSKLADERIAVAPRNTSAVPRWVLWIIIALLALTALGLGNIYLERMMADPAPAPAPVFVPPSSSNAVPAPANTAPAPAPTPAPVSVPPQTVHPLPEVTPAPTTPASPPAPPAPQHADAIPADFAIERGSLATQPFAVEGAVARQAGSSEHITTLKSLVCGRGVTCTSDALLNGPEAKQLIALQMLMSQIGDRFCSPRRPVRITGEVSADTLEQMASVAKCAGAHAYPCKESDNKVCPPDADAIQGGDMASRAQLLRWALWKTGST